MYLTFLQSHRDRIEALEVKLTNLDFNVNKVKKEIKEEIEKTMTEHQEEMKELTVTKHVLENEISTIKRHRVREVIQVSFLSSVSF